MELGFGTLQARQFVLPGVGETTEIRLARHGADAGVLGAALLAGHEIEAFDTAADATAPPIEQEGRR